MKKVLLIVLVSCLGGALTAQNVSFTNTNVSTNYQDIGVVDMNGDHLDDLLSVSRTNIQIFYQQTDGSFIERDITTPQTANSPSWSLAAADYDENGYTDLLYGGGNGVTFMTANSDGTDYTETSGSQFVFSQRSNFIDINNDGRLDAFVCHDVEPNVYYIQDEFGNLEYNQGGLGDFSSGGNYGSVWIDYDNDRDMDLFLAKCGGSAPRRTNQMHTNNGDGTYAENAAALGLDDPMQTWSSAWGDFNNDGFMDAWVGASNFNDGFHRLMMNQGDGTFIDEIVGSGLESFNATGIENAAHDFNNDGNIDIASNGNILLGNGDGTFTVQSNLLSGSNGAFGDLNGDGFIDAFRGGIIRYNDSNSNNWVSFATVGTDSNLDGIGARVEIETATGIQIRDVRSGEGFEYMSSINTHFGIGSDSEISRVTVYWPSGAIDIYDQPGQIVINKLNVLTEKETTLGLEEAQVANLILFPNPTTDVLNLSLKNTDGAIYTIFDLTGKRVANGFLENASVNVEQLPLGNYFLRIFQDGALQTQRFVKK